LSTPARDDEASPFDAHRREDLLAYPSPTLLVASRKFDAGRYRSFRQFADGAFTCVTRKKLSLPTRRQNLYLAPRSHRGKMPRLTSFNQPDGLERIHQVLAVRGA
jgi:hypothetical protein